MSAITYYSRGVIDGKNKAIELLILKLKGKESIKMVELGKILDSVSNEIEGREKRLKKIKARSLYYCKECDKKFLQGSVKKHRDMGHKVMRLTERFKGDECGVL